MPIGDESKGEEFGLLGWIMFLMLALGLLVAGYAEHLGSHAIFFP